MKTTRTKAAMIGLLLAGCASKTSHPPEPQVPIQRPPAPLFEGLGNLHHPMTTKSKEAQRYFDQGFILLYGFNHAEAIRSFWATAQIDPDCAIAYWGIAYAYGPNINMPMDEKAVPKAWEALQKAISLRAKASPVEQ